MKRETQNVHIIVSLTLIGTCCGLPILCLNDWQTDLTLFIDVRVINFRLERNLGWLERIFSGKVYFYAESSSIVGRIILKIEMRMCEQQMESQV